MDDLIRRENAMQRFLDEIKQSGKDHIHINTIKKLLDDVDVAYNVDNVAEEVRKHCNKCMKCETYECSDCDFVKVIDAIMRGGVDG